MEKENRQVKIIHADFGFPATGQSRILLKDISLEIQPGELVALIGKNGSGKTTLLKTLVRLHPLIGGNIRIFEKDMYRYSRNEFARLTAYVSTEIIRTDQMRLRDLVELGRFPYTNWIGHKQEEDVRAVDDAIHSAGLDALQDVKITRLSDGERQRAMIARILAQNSDFLLLDEPTAFLDIPNKYDIISLLRSLAHQGKTILFSTHDLNLALQFCDKIWLIEEENILEGAPEDLVINGSVGNLFNSDKVSFNKENAEFEPVAASRGEISMMSGGNDFVRRWTTAALRRAGYRIVPTEKKNLARVEIITEKNSYVWKLHAEDENLLFRNLYELNCHLINTY